MAPFISNGDLFFCSVKLLFIELNIKSYHKLCYNFSNNNILCKLNKKCETTLILSHDELMKIYIILNNANFKMLSKDITICEDFIEPSYTVNFSYQIDDLENEINIYGTMNKTYSEWNTYFEFGYAYYKILNEFIFASEEFKNLPPNQNLYE